MSDKRTITVSKYLSKHLRHAPEALGLVLEPGGWVPVDTLLAASAGHGFPITRAELDHVVATSDKKRFAFDPSGTKIRANQGHSTDVELQFTPTTPPSVLYHGTAEQNRGAIESGGLLKMRRHHVHLSADIETAVKVGSRHGRPLVFIVDAGRMVDDGLVFFVSENGVWLTDHVPAQYLRALSPETT
jgi:putative RNA 2'-phosphotransferase